MLKILLGSPLIFYPIVVYFGLGHLGFRWIACGLMAALIIRAYLIPTQYRYRAWGMFAIGLLICALIFFLEDPIYLRLYPVMTSCLGLFIFGYSLYRPPSIIETFAQIFEFQEAKMPSHIVKYTRNITKLWCAFFIMNTFIALYSVFTSLEFWTLYNGLISYVLMGFLLGGEFIYRQLVVKKQEIKSDV